MKIDNNDIDRLIALLSKAWWDRVLANVSGYQLRDCIKNPESHILPVSEEEKALWKRLSSPEITTELKRYADARRGSLSHGNKWLGAVLDCLLNDASRQSDNTKE